MSNEIIATIRLAPSEVGYYDEHSRIYLTASRRTANVYAGTNCTQLRRSVKSGRLILLTGSLGEEETPIKKKNNRFVGPTPMTTVIYNNQTYKVKDETFVEVETPAKSSSEEEKIEKTEEAVIEDPKESAKETVVKEVSEEAVVEETVIEVATEKKSRRSKKTK